MELSVTEIYGKCPDCNNKRFAPAWCTNCDIGHLKDKFSSWSSENMIMDNFIRHTQINAKSNEDFLEWIDFGGFELVRSFRKGSFSSIYTAIWLEGPKLVLDEGTQKWLGSGPTEVILKRLDDSQKLSQEYINQLYKYHRALQNGSLADVFGITKDPTSSYMFVMGYYSSGNLYSYLDETFVTLCWGNIVDMLWSISAGLEYIHRNNLIHGNLHGGNILIKDEDETIDTKIADVGLHGPADKKPSDQKIYGVIPFVAPEVFYNQTPTKESDIYSFGMIMWMLAYGVRPYYDRAHDHQLVAEIMEGLKPNPFRDIKDTPPVFHRLIQRCLDLNPNNRPTSVELCENFERWTTTICDDPVPNDLSKEFDRAEEIKFLTYKEDSVKLEAPVIHSNAIYHSRPLETIIRL